MLPTSCPQTPLPFLRITLGCDHWSQPPSLNYLNLPGQLYPYTLSHYTWVTPLPPPPPYSSTVLVPAV